METTQVDRLKVEDCQEKAHFKAMSDARITFRQSTAIVLFLPLQSKQLQPDYVSSYKKCISLQGTEVTDSLCLEAFENNVKL